MLCGSHNDSSSVFHQPVDSFNYILVSDPDCNDVVTVMGNAACNSAFFQAYILYETNLNRIISIPAQDNQFQNIPVRVRNQIAIFYFWQNKLLACDKFSVLGNYHSDFSHL